MSKTTETAKSVGAFKNLVAGNENNKIILRGTVDAILGAEIFKKSDNVRDEELGYKGDNNQLEGDLVKTGHVIEPVYIGVRDMSRDKFLKATQEEQMEACVGMKGFRRIHTSAEIARGEGNRFPGWEKFDPNVRCELVFGLTEAQIYEYRNDHGSQKGINRYELMRVVRQALMNPIAKTNHQIVWELRNLFDMQQSEGERQALANKIAARTPDVNSLKDHENVVWITFNHHKGTFQFLQRIATTPHNVIRDTFRKFIYGLDGGFQITRSELVKIWDLEKAEFDKAWASLTSEKQAKQNGEKPDNTKWSVKVLEEKQKLYADYKWPVVIFGTIAGQVESAVDFNEVMALVTSCNVAYDFDKEAFKAFVEGQVAKHRTKTEK